MELAFRDVAKRVVPGQTAAFDFRLAGLAHIAAVELEISAKAPDFDDSWCRTEVTAVGDGRLIVDVPLGHAAVGRTYRLELRAVDRGSGAIAEATCRLSFIRAPLCVRFPPGRSVTARPDGSLAVKVPVLNCGPVKFDVSLDLSHKKGEFLHVDYDGTASVDAGQLATIEATVHGEDGKPLSTKDVTVTATCDGMPPEPVWPEPDRESPGLPRRRWLVLAALLLAVALLGGVAVYAVTNGDHRASPPVTTTALPPVGGGSAGMSGTSSNNQTGPAGTSSNNQTSTNGVGRPTTGQPPNPPPLPRVSADPTALTFNYNTGQLDGDVTVSVTGPSANTSVSPSMSLTGSGSGHYTTGNGCAGSYHSGQSCSVSVHFDGLQSADAVLHVGDNNPADPGVNVMLTGYYETIG